MQEIALTDVALYLQTALLGAITPNIRIVYFTVEPKSVDVIFLFDGKPSIQDVDRAQIVATEVASNFDNPDFDCVVFCKSQKSPKKIHLPLAANSVYRRWEP